MRAEQVQEFGGNGQAQAADVQQQFAGAAQALVDAEAAVKAGVVDVALPAHGGAGLFEVDAHDDQQVFLVLVHGGAQLAGVFHRLAVIVDGAGADHDQQAVVAAMQHVGDLGAALLDQGLDGGGYG
ncbi:hypothetical protein D3C71_1503070 [compost metagenome]